MALQGALLEESSQTPWVVGRGGSGLWGSLSMAYTVEVHCLTALEAGSPRTSVPRGGSFRGLSGRICPLHLLVPGGLLAIVGVPWLAEASA